jgi:hypothetical protein
MGVTYKASDVDLQCPVGLKSSASAISVMSRHDFVLTRGALGSKATAFKRRLRLTLGQNREQLLLRDGTLRIS